MPMQKLTSHPAAIGTKNSNNKMSSNKNNRKREWRRRAKKIAKRIEMKLLEQDSICQRNQHMNGILNKMIIKICTVLVLVRASLKYQLSLCGGGTHKFHRRIYEVLIPYMEDTVLCAPGLNIDNEKYTETHIRFGLFFSFDCVRITPKMWQLTKPNP